MPWKPLPRIAFAVATYPFAASSPADLPLELGDELYIIEQGGVANEWYRGYLVAPPSLLSGLTSVRGQTLEARVFSGIFPRNCVEVREVLDDPLVNEKPSSADFEYGTNRSLVSNSKSPQHRTSVRRYGSTKGYPPKRGSATATDIGQDSGVGGLPSRSPSQPASNLEESQSLYRELSHRSIRSLTSQSSVVRLSPSADEAPIRPPAPVPMLKIGDETPTSLAEPLVDEIASCLREWHSKDLHELLLSQHYSTLEQLTDLVRQLNIARRQLLHQILTDKELEQKREQIVWGLVHGNKLLGGDVIVRDPKRSGRLLTSEDSAVEISKLQSTMSLLDHPPVSQLEPTNLHHLLLELKAAAECNLDAPLLSVYLFSLAPNDRPKALTETVVFDISSNEDLNRGANLEKYKTLFKDLNSLDVGMTPGSGASLYLVAKIYANVAVEQPSQDLARADSSGDAGSSPAASRESLTSAATSVRRGRQSLMWAQKQLGSTRRRAPPDPKRSQANRIENPPARFSEKARPDTSQSLRSTTPQGTQSVKRMVAVGTLDIKELMNQERGEDQRLTFWSPATNGATFSGSSVKNDQLLTQFMPNVNKRFVQCSSLGYIDLALHSFLYPDAEELIVRRPTLLQGISQTPKLGFSGAPKKPRSDIYLTLSEASLPAKALLSHPERGPVPLPLGTDYSNIQLTLELRKKNGERIDSCIYPTSNGPGITAWRTIAVDRGASWDQVVKLVLPEEDVPEAHLIMSVANAPGFPFALCWLPLWDQDAFIRDGIHQPLLYLYDKVTSSSDKGRGAYMALPWNSRAKDDTTKDETFTGPVASLQMQTYLCSTIFSQDRVLVGLLKWREQSEEQLLGLLRQFTFVPEIDIVKLVDDLFNALFSIIVNHSDKDEYEDLVFNALVTILSIVHDRRFNLGPSIDKYTESKFDYPFATPCLIRSYLRLLARPADPQNSRRLHATFKVGRQMLRFITTARAKQKIKEDSVGVSNDLSFRRDYRSIFTAFESVMQDSSPILIGSKTLIVQYLHSWLPTGDETFSEDEVYQIASSFIGSCSNVQGKLILYRLLLILHLSKRSFFAQSTIQRRFAASTEAWIEPYWGTHHSPHGQLRDQIRLCCSIVSVQSEAFDVAISKYLPKIVESYRAILVKSRDHRKTGALGLLFPSSYPFPTRPSSASDDFDEPLIELAALLSRCSGSNLNQILDDSGSGKVETVSGALDTMLSILSGDAFPIGWLSLYTYHHHAAFSLLETLQVTMTASFLPSPDDADDFNTGLWSKFLTTLIALVGSKTLALETFAEQKRRAVWKIAGDVREKGANLLRRSWEAIGWESSPDDQKRYGVQRVGGFQVQYVPGLVAQIIDLCLSVHEGLRKTAVKILQTMIISEWTLNEDLSVIEAEMIDCLDNTFKSNKIGENITQKIFVNELLDLFEPLARIPGDGLWQAIKSLVSTVDELLDLLAAVHSPEITEAVRIMHTLQLMDYLRDMRKEGIFIRYVHQLADVQSVLHNHTEAGLALQLHANLYRWSPVTVGALGAPVFPEQTSFERKEQLYFEMITHFEEGAAWDCALACYKELAEQYEHFQYDFAKLARTQHSSARIYERIAKGERPNSRYFKVTYCGLGFPDSLRDKEFIFQGESAEKQTTFADRLRLQHPAAHVVSSGDVEKLEGQFLQISSVTPYRDLEHPLYQVSRVPQAVREHVLQSRPNRFAVTSRRHSPATGVQDQWMEKTVYSTIDTFPTILGKSEIVAVETIRLSPLQTAVERTTRKTSEMAILQRRINDGDESAFTNLTESIKTSVDPTSLASVAQYRQLLPSPLEPNEEEDESIAEEPPLELMQNALKQALLDHASTLRHCVSLYTHPPHINVQAALSDSMHSTFAPELALLAPPTVTPSPPPSSYQLQSPSLPPSRGFSTDLPMTAPLTNGITALPQPGGSDSEPPPFGRTRSRLSLGFLKSPSKSYGSLEPEGSVSLATPDEGSLSSAGRLNGNVNARQDSMTESLLGPRPELGRMKSQSSAGGENERPMTAQSGMSGRMRKRLSNLGLGKGSVKSRSGGRGAVEVVEEE
ncbi:MAG: hypothetical protein Q9219_003586 [cf. Caloplaca sp. 3 TL-2023]